MLLTRLITGDMRSVMAPSVAVIACARVCDRISLARVQCIVLLCTARLACNISIITLPKSSVFFCAVFALSLTISVSVALSRPASSLDDGGGNTGTTGAALSAAAHLKVAAANKNNRAIPRTELCVLVSECLQIELSHFGEENSAEIEMLLHLRQTALLSHGATFGAFVFVVGRSHKHTSIMCACGGHKTTALASDYRD